MIRRLSRLFRLPLSLMNGIAALGGYCLFPAPRSSAAMMIACSGVTLLAMGGATLNQVLERDIDALMTRTDQRPLPRGEMTPAVATSIGFGVILAGSALLLTADGLLPALLGLAALVWYLAVYTPLKRRTPLALPLGALCGAVPPLIGWCLAGGIRRTSASSPCPGCSLSGRFPISGCCRVDTRTTTVGPASRSLRSGRGISESGSWH